MWNSTWKHVCTTSTGRTQSVNFKKQKREKDRDRYRGMIRQNLFSKRKTSKFKITFTFLRPQLPLMYGDGNSGNGGNNLMSYRKLLLALYTNEKNEKSRPKKHM